MEQLVRRWAAVLLVACGMAATPAAAAVSPLELPREPVQAGAEVSFTGRGSAPEPPVDCQTILVDPVAGDVAVGKCTVDGHPYGSVALPADFSPGTYELSVCIPDCSWAWGGRALSTITVATTEPAGFTTSGDIQHQAAAKVLTALQVEPDPVAPGEQVFVEAPTLPSLSEQCVAEWDGAPAVAYTCTVDEAGVASGVITAPISQPGRRTLTVCWPDCVQPVGRPAVADVQVVGVAPPPEPRAGRTPGGGTETSSAATPVIEVTPDKDVAAVGRTEWDHIAWPGPGPLLLAFVVAGCGAVYAFRTALRPASSAPLPLEPPVPAAQSLPRPVLRPAPDRAPTITTTILDTRQVRPAVRVRGLADETPQLTLEVRP